MLVLSQQRQKIVYLQNDLQLQVTNNIKRIKADTETHVFSYDQKY